MVLTRADGGFGISQRGAPSASASAVSEPLVNASSRLHHENLWAAAAAADPIQYEWGAGESWAIVRAYWPTLSWHEVGMN